MRLSHISFKKFPPFKDCFFELPKLKDSEHTAEVQFFVGANGSGKTRLLSLLLAALGNEQELNSRLSEPFDFSVFWENADSRFVYLTTHKTCFMGGKEVSPVDSSNPQFLQQNGFRKNVGGIYESMKKTAPGVSYCGLAFRGASAEVSDSEVAALQTVQFGKPEEHLQFSRAAKEDQIVGQSMVNLKMGAAMDMLEDGKGEGRATKISKRLETAVSQITGRSFSFRVETHPKVSLRVNWGEAKGLRLMQLPDGLRAIIGWLVSCAAKLEVQFPEDQDPLDANVILVIDEPEGHLHPAWQRKVLPAVQALLPNAQIFVATHSPWIISSVNAGWIHVRIKG